MIFLICEKLKGIARIKIIQKHSFETFRMRYTGGGLTMATKKR